MDEKQKPWADREETHEYFRMAIARANYVWWRMRDLPAIYTDLMPPTYDAKTLWTAEKCIRSQYEEDQKMAANPWHEIGPAVHLLDFSGMSPGEKIEFDLEIKPPLGLTSLPKPGREDELQEEIERRQAASPEYQAHLRRQQERKDFDAACLKQLREEHPLPPRDASDDDDENP